MAQPRMQSTDPDSPFYSADYAFQKELESQTKRLGDKVGPREEQKEKILDPTTLVEVVRETIDGMRPDPDELQAAIDSGYRTKVKKFSWEVAQLVTFVDRDGMGRLALNALVNDQETLQAVQATGDWQVAAAVVKIERIDKEYVQIKDGRHGEDLRVRSTRQAVVLTAYVRWIDMRNGEEVIYKRGRPSEDDHISETILRRLGMLQQPLAPNPDQAAVDARAEQMEKENAALKDRLAALEQLIAERLPVPVSEPDPVSVSEAVKEPALAEEAPVAASEQDIESELDAAMAEAPKPAKRRTSRKKTTSRSKPAVDSAE